MKELAILIIIALDMGASQSIVKDVAIHTRNNAKRYNLDPDLLIAVMKRESRVRNLQHVNKTKDYGIMQIHCPTRKYAWWCKNLKRLKKIQYNILIGSYIIATRRNRCIKYHKHKSHWIRHYNWKSKDYDKKIKKTLKRIKKIRKSIEPLIRNKIQIY